MDSSNASYGVDRSKPGAGAEAVEYIDPSYDDFNQELPGQSEVGKMDAEHMRTIPPTNDD